MNHSAQPSRTPRGRKRQKIWLWPSVAVVLLLLAVAIMRKVQQAREPIAIYFAERNIPSRVLFERLAKEIREHPYAYSVSIVNSNGESVDYLQRHGTLEYGMLSSGWFYEHVEPTGIELLARAHLDQFPVTLSPSLDTQLRKRGWKPG